MQLIGESGLDLSSTEGEDREGFYFGSKGHPLEEKPLCSQRGITETQKTEKTLYNNIG